MSTHRDAMASQEQTGKIAASTISIAAGCHPARAINASDRIIVPTPEGPRVEAQSCLRSNLMQSASLPLL